MPRTGRPPAEHPRTQTVRFRLTEDEWAALTAAARLAGLKPTDYARSSALAAVTASADGTRQGFLPGS